MKKSIILSIVLILFIATAAFAAQKGKGKTRKGPPPAAIEACKELTKGEACSFTTKRGNRKGACIDRRKNKGLVCKVKPPQVAVKACKGLTKGEACSFTAKRGQRKGVCRIARGEKKLACRPKKHAGKVKRRIKK